jgi:hypothetical protein
MWIYETNPDVLQPSLTACVSERERERERERESPAVAYRVRVSLNPKP